MQLSIDIELVHILLFSIHLFIFSWHIIQILQMINKHDRKLLRVTVSENHFRDWKCSVFVGLQLMLCWDSVRRFSVVSGLFSKMLLSLTSISRVEQASKASPPGLKRLSFLIRGYQGKQSVPRKLRSSLSGVFIWRKITHWLSPMI